MRETLLLLMDDCQLLAEVVEPNRLSDTKTSKPSTSMKSEN